MKLSIFPESKAQALPSKEEWRDIQDFEGCYQVSNLGRVRSLDRTIYTKDGKSQNWKGRLLKQRVSNSGYNQVGFKKQAKTYMRDVHRLVAIAFIPNLDSLREVNHMNGIKHDNSVSNLEWVSSTQNNNHALDLGLMPYGEKCSWSKLSDVQVLEIYNLANKKELTHKQIAIRFNVSKGTVSKIKLGTTGSRVTGHGRSNET